MGLDSYLNKMPRYKNVTPNQISIIEYYFDLEAEKVKGSEYASCTLEEWCGHDESELPDKETIKYFKPFYIKRYSSWDTEKKYGHFGIKEQIGYWRKANQIHSWFVNHVQDGEDDCNYHHEITKEILEELLDTCETVYNSCSMMVGIVKNGETLVDGKWVPNMQPGKVIIDSSVAEDLLPTCSGFFFGNTDYNEYYVEDIKETIDVVTKALETTDFDKEMIYYVSSW